MLSTLLFPNKCKGVGIMNHEYEVKLGQNIRKLREKSGLTQEQLSARLQLCGCDVTRSALAKMEVGQRHIYPDELLLLKELLGVRYEEIFEADECAFLIQRVKKN